ncbi:transmembrane protein 14B [Homo sapiens]|uniref:Transmembrane protein 14B n=1 Tax=Homo sapiens TaxID=9606 RepID=C9J786_HUMAN|nr:transmembrane protein 14B [Homo sapiens]KAI4016805.1 transmembrane protein 14B [Homo sapiens]
MEKPLFPLVPLHWFGFGYTALVVSGGIVGYVKTAATSVTFVGVMGMRSYYYGKFMPVGLIAGARYFHSITLLYHVEFSLLPRILYAFKTLLVSEYLMLCIN